MLFKSSQASLPIYLFDRNTLTLSQGKITSVVPSHIDMKLPGKMITDITCIINNNTQTYSIDDSLSIAYFGSSAISLDLDTILREIENMASTSQQALSETEHHKDIVAKCNQLLIDHNPTLKAKRETEARFNNIESSISELKSLFTDFMKKME